MRIAVCFSGQMRTAVPASQNIKRFIGDLWDNCDFFIHTWDINQHKPYYTDGYPNFSPPPWRPDTVYNSVPPIEKLSAETLGEYKSIYNPRAMIIEEFNSYQPCFKSCNATRNRYQWRSFKQSIDLCAAYAAKENILYDAVLRLRPDVIFHPRNRLVNDIIQFNNNREIFYSTNLCPNRIDDIYWIANLKTMLALSSFGTPETSCEVSFENYVKMLDIETLTTATYGYSPVRPESSHFDTMTEFNEIIKTDQWWYCSVLTL